MIKVLWEIKERIGNLWVPKIHKYNLVTSYGLTAFASAPAGTYVPPIYLVIDSAHTTFASSVSSGAGSVSLVADPTIVGDNQLVLGVGLIGQETVTFTAKSGAGPYTFTLSGTTANSHTAGDPCVRAVNANDTLASVVTEAQYDPTYAAGKRAVGAASYSSGTGLNTMQFFIAGTQATNLFFAHVGLADSQTIGAGNLHNYASFGYNHTTTNDVEIDINWTVTTS